MSPGKIPPTKLAMNQRHFVIPLKPASKPVAFPPDFKKHIAFEFAMRYLTEVSFPQERICVGGSIRR